MEGHKSESFRVPTVLLPTLLLLRQNQFQLAQTRFCCWNARTPDILTTENKCLDDIRLPIGMVIGYWWPTA